MSKSIPCQQLMSKSAERVTKTEPPESALCLELRSGELVLWNGRVPRFEGLKGDRARIRDTNSAGLREVLVTELRGLPSLPIVELDQYLKRLRTIDTPDWSETRNSRSHHSRDTMSRDGTTTCPCRFSATGAWSAIAQCVLPLFATRHRQVDMERERLIRQSAPESACAAPPSRDGGRT